MNEYSLKQPVKGVVWKPGVKLPNCVQVDFPEGSCSVGTFPAHTMIPINGEYKVVFEGTLVAYAEELGNPIGTIRATDLFMNYEKRPAST